MKQPHAQYSPTPERKENLPCENSAIEIPSDAMMQAGAEFLYGKTRAAAIELGQEADFQACCEQAKQLFIAMMMAKTAVSQQQLAEGEPLNNPPLLW